MSPAAKAARLSLLRESWERYHQQCRGAKARVVERSGGAIFCERLSEENLSTFADVREPDALAQIASGA